MNNDAVPTETLWGTQQIRGNLFPNAIICPQNVVNKTNFLKRRLRVFGKQMFNKFVESINLSFKI